MLPAARSTSSAACSENATRGLPGSTKLSLHDKSVWPRYGVDANCLLLARWPGSGIGVYTSRRSAAAKDRGTDEIPRLDGRRTTLRPALRGEEPAASEPGPGGWGA